MRILQLAPIWETVPPPAYGGTETVVSALTEELVRRGHQVTLCASGDSQTAAELFAVQPYSLRQAGLTADALQYSLVHVALALKDADQFDIVHNHNGPPSELAMAMSHLVRTPFLTTLHNYPVAQTRFIWEHYTGWYNTISKSMTAAIEPFPRAKFAGHVHNAIDVCSFPFQAEKKDFVLFIGRFTREKAAHLAIEAAKRAGVRIVLAGKISMPDEHEYFETSVRPLLIPGRVEYLGEADALLKRRLFADARTLLMPMLWDEPFGLVITEAMACGTPVIAYDRGAAPELIIPGRTGFLVEDVAEMAAMIERAGEIDPDACRRHVEEHFSPAALADRYLAVYQRILDECTLEVGYDRALF